MFEKHPVVVWSSIVLTVMTMGVGLIWTQLDDIQDELTKQAVLLTEIRREQGHIGSRQRWLASEVNREVGSLAIDVGRLMERTEETE